MFRRLLTTTVAAVLVVAAPAGAATATMSTKSVDAPKGPPYDVPVLTVAGDATDETLAVTLGTTISLTGSIQAGSGCTQAAPDQVSCPNSADFNADLKEGADRLTITVAAEQTSPPMLSLTGGPGNDVLDARAKSLSTLNGGEGDDTLASDASLPTFDGGPGADVLEGRAPAGANGAVARWSEPVAVDLAAGTAKTASGTDTLKGDFWSLTLSDGNDELVAATGNVTVLAGAGDDTITGSPGEDLLEGGPGADEIRGGGGDDSLYADRISGGEPDRDRLLGEDGDDRLTTAGGLIDGGAGDDSLTLPADKGRTRDRAIEVECGGGADTVDAPGAYTPLPGTCELITGGDAQETNIRITRSGASTVKLRLRSAGRACRWRVVLDTGRGRTRLSLKRRRKTWTATLTRTPLTRPSLLSISRCSGKSLVPTVTLAR